MRFVAAIAVFACAAAPAAQAQDPRESRYGPSAESRSAPQSASLTYTGPMLGWAGKAPVAAAEPVEAQMPPPAPARATPRPPAPTPAAISAPEPYAPWRQLGAAPVSQTQAAPAPAQAAQVAALRPAAPLPQSLYAKPTPAAAPQPALRPTLAAAPSPPSADALGPSLSRTYSVGRQYGLQPDALPPLKPNGMVFIAPSDTPAPTKADAPRHSSAEWLAGGPLGDEADREAGKDVSLR